MRILIATLSDNEVHQDIVFSMFECIYNQKDQQCDIWVMGIKNPKMPVISSPHTYLVDCPKRPGIERKTFDLISLHSIISWINKQKFDVIFFESLHVWNLAIMMRCHKKTRIYQMIHDLIPHEGDKQEKAVEIMNRAVCKMADYIVLANRKYIQTVTEKYGVDPKRVRSVDMWRRFPKYTKPMFTQRVLFFGRMHAYKGVDNLLEMVEKCPDIQFYALGQVDEQVRNLIDQMKKYPNIVLDNEYISDEKMAEAFISSDWIVLPYNTATQSGVVIDGYRYSRPCIAFDVGALKEQINDGYSGYLVEAGNIDAFIKKLREAVNMDKDTYTQMTKQAYEYGLSKYAAEGAMDRFLELIKE